MKCSEKESFQKPSLNIRLDSENTETIEVVDDTDLTDKFKKSILSSYLSDLYDDLVSRTDNPKMGISKTTFLEVLLTITLVSQYRRSYW
jgi:hypothetical protein